MRYFLFSFIALCLMASTSKAQDQVSHTQYFLHPVLINPAATGIHNGQQFVLNYRNNWSSFSGSPRAYTFSYDGSFMEERVGLGAVISNRTFGVENRFRAGASYSYRFGGEDWKWSVGLSTEYERFSLSNEVFTSDLYDAGDPIVQAAADGIGYFDLTAGVYGTFQESFFFGLAAPQMVRARIDDVGFEDDSDVRLFQYFNLLLGYSFDVENYGMTVEPSVFIKRLRNIPFQVDFNLLTKFFDDQLMAGVSYSTGSGDRLGFLMGTRFNNVRLYYSYDMSFQPLQDYANGSHEFTMSILLKD